MATTLANLVTAETNGYSLLTHCRRVNIEPTVSADVMERTWAQLQNIFGGDLPQALLDFSPPHHATLSYLCTEWEAYTGDEKPAAFCNGILTSKIFFEVCCASLSTEVHRHRNNCRRTS